MENKFISFVHGSRYAFHGYRKSKGQSKTDPQAEDIKRVYTVGLV